MQECKDGLGHPQGLAVTFELRLEALTDGRANGDAQLASYAPGDVGQDRARGIVTVHDSYGSDVHVCCLRLSLSLQVVTQALGQDLNKGDHSHCRNTASAHRVTQSPWGINPGAHVSVASPALDFNFATTPLLPVFDPDSLPNTTLHDTTLQPCLAHLAEDNACLKHKSPTSVGGQSQTLHCFGLQSHILGQENSGDCRKNCNLHAAVMPFLTPY